MTHPMQRTSRLIVAIALSLCNVAFADDVAAPAAAPTATLVAEPAAAPVNAPSPAPAVVPAGTEVVVKTLDAMSSQTAKLGDHFAVEVSRNVLIGDQVVIPAGTRGSGTVVFARKKGTMGKSGALDVRVDYVELPSGRLKLKASDNLRGTNRSGSALGVSLAFGGLFALAVHGDDISMPAGTEMLAAVSALPLAAPVATTVAAAAPAVTAEAAATSAQPATNASANPAPADASAPSKIP
jgi:hypothetical protein